MHLRPIVFGTSLFLAVSLLSQADNTIPFTASRPRPSGFAEASALPSPKDVAFEAIAETADVTYDLVAHFSKGPLTFRVDSVSIDGAPCDRFVVANQGVFNGNRIVHGNENFTVSLYADWQPNACGNQRGPIMKVEPGSTYVEKMAFCPAYLGEGDRRYASFIDASVQLNQPLAQRWGR